MQDQAVMERLPEQIVDWHNRHPLARRIRVDDVHTVGVVALPFVRATAQASAAVEPVLTDTVSTFDGQPGTPATSRAAGWLQQLKALLPPGLRGRAPAQQWRTFSEKFLPGLSPAGIERFALDHGYAEAPGTPESHPWRVILIDDKLASARSGWPFELYLLSAGIEVGDARTRVLCGRGIPSQIIGRRLWDPLRAGGAAAALALLLALAAWLLWPRHAADPTAPAPGTAASAPSEPASAASAAAPVEAASAAMPASAAASGSADAPASAPEDAASASTDEPPDIRPRLVERSDGVKRPPLLSSGKPPPADPGAAAKPAPDAEHPRPQAAGAGSPDTPADKLAPADPRLARLAGAPDRVAVALVGPPGSKADAEALLKKMKEGLQGVHSSPEALQADVIQTPDGWRATVWPFPSREQAQLINATLVARGLKTKAVNF
ncbi:hypothetical protein [Roseateles sp. BYS96W]|uniref:SPOR domain-containing protein n=1 Tax=Pelomonas nitida TaxID=3299027 RepID=A0ABW7GC94_9BURK